MTHRDKVSRTDFRALLESVEAVSPVEAIDVVTDVLATVLGATAVSFLIADFSGRAAVRFGASPSPAGPGRQHGNDRAHTVSLPGTVYEQVLRTQQVEVRESGHGAQVIVPVTDRGDVIGVVELWLPWRPDEQAVADVAAAGHALAYIVVANRRHTDLFEWGQRTTPFSLAAEIQHRLLPDSFTCEAGQFTISGWMEPASAVGGDTFDYALDRDTLHVSITDAVGHDVNAALLATVLVGSLRNGRRRGMNLAEQAASANDALAAHSTTGEVVTGQLLRVDLRNGEASIVNAGHPFPLRLRGGRVEEIDLAIDMPFGLRPGRSLQVQRFPLQPGDRIVFVTDGMLERNAAEVDVRAALGRSAGLHPREVVHELGEAAWRATGGDLRDDATVVCLDWYGGAPRRRHSNGGADEERASPVSPVPDSA